MGYILPNTPLQYADYANRLAFETKGFSYIEGVQAVAAHNRFFDEVKRLQKHFVEKEQVKKTAKHSQPVYAPTEDVVFYQPKPMSTAEIVGKGFVINAYA